MSQPPPPLDSVSVLTALASGLMGESVAPYAPAFATYIVILLGFVAGVSIGIFRRPPESRVSVYGFVVVMLCITISLDVFIAQYVSEKTGISAGFLEAFIAVLIPAIGEDWLNFIKFGVSWAMGKLKSRFGQS